PTKRPTASDAPPMIAAGSTYVGPSVLRSDTRRSAKFRRVKIVSVFSHERLPGQPATLGGLNSSCPMLLRAPSTVLSIDFAPSNLRFVTTYSVGLEILFMKLFGSRKASLVRTVRSTAFMSPLVELKV